MTSAAVYNEYWATGGGGETFCGGIAQALCRSGHEVTLVAASEFDVDRLAERLGVDLRECALRIVDGGPLAVAEASADYDLFVNGSYLSAVRNHASTGVYVVHFPGSRPPTSRLRTLARHLPTDGLAQPVRFEWSDGFHAPDPGAAGAVWSSQRARLEFEIDDPEPVVLHLLFAHLRPAAAGPAEVTIRVDGEIAATGVVPPAGSGILGRVRGRAGSVIDVPVQGSGRRTLEIEADVFVPSQLGLGADDRQLGVPLRGITSGSTIARAIATIAPSTYHRAVAPATPEVIASYDVVASNSEFTSGFVEDWWSLEESPVLYPPVHLRDRTPSASKQPSIVAVGRFFDSSSGHSKKQLELVRAFRRLRAGGVDGWSLTFVGGVDPRADEYLSTVRAEAEGLPIEFLIDASGAARDAAIGEASIFWHATGLGEDASAYPDRMEHFGISTVEAMSAGAVPVVFGGGGQLEVVEHGVSGFHFHTLDELVSLTRGLVDDPTALSRLADGAAERAEMFGFAAFEERLEAIVANATSERPESA